MSTLRNTERLALELDAADALSRFRERFHIAPGVIYLDGNSLGLMSRDAEAAVRRVLDIWRHQAIGGYSLPRPESWYYTGEELGALMAPLVGAGSHEVVLTGTTVVNLHALLCTFYRPTSKRRRLVCTALDFPSDVYALQSQIRLHGGDPERDLILVPSRDGRTISEQDVIAALTDEVAVAVLPSVLYRSGQLLDMFRLAAAGRERGVIVGWDCSHSVGVVPHRFDEAGIDFAVWCTYKYLNGGPGAVAALYVHSRHHERGPGLAGWWGHDKTTQFDMAHHFTPAADAGAWQISSNAQLAAAPVRAALHMVHEAGLSALRAKSLRLTDYLMQLIDELGGPPYDLRVGNPREPERRGGHVAVEHSTEAGRICKALKKRGVVPDFRMPNVIRLAPVPLFNTFHEVWRAVEELKAIMETREYEQFVPGRELIA